MTILRPLILALIAAALIIAFTNAPGTFDDYAFITWAKFLNPTGPFRGYAQLSRVTDLDYPPIGITIMWATIKLGHHFAWPDLQSFKLPLVLTTLAAPAIAYTRTRAADDALILLLLITPFGLILGYTDVTYLPFLLAAFYLAEREIFWAAGLSLALCAFIKWQPIIFAPIFLIAAYRHAPSPKNFAKRAAPTTIFVIAVLLLYNPATVIHVLLTATSDNEFSAQGVNLAWLLSATFEYLHLGGLTFQPNGTITLLTTPSPATAVNVAMTALRYLFYAIFLAHLIIYALGPRTSSAFLISATACAAAQFTFNTGVHENHFFVTLIAAFAAWQSKALDNFTFAACAAIALLNILFFYGFGDGFNFTNLANIDSTIFLAIAEILTYALILRQQLQTCLAKP
jgi:Gpi18-like mannosyltransferase